MVTVPRLDLLSMPRPYSPTAQVRRAPVAVSADALAAMTACRDALLLLRDHAQAYAAGGPAGSIDVSALGAEDMEVLDQVLGTGEVQAILGSGPDEIRVQEAVMPGLWRVHGAAGHTLEVGDMPAVVRAAADARPASLDIPATLPEGAMNVAPVLVEIADALTRVCSQPGQKVKEINLTLLPMTPVDLDVLGEALGTAPLTILSRGYGNCRITACAPRGVWRVSYFNSDDKMILDVVEVGDIPAAALAAREDVDGSVERLEQVIGAYWS